MIITMGRKKREIAKVMEAIGKKGWKAQAIPGKEKTIIAVKGIIKYDEGFISHLKTFDGVEEIQLISTKFKLSSTAAGDGNGNIVSIKKNVAGRRVKVEFGGRHFPVIAGPCSLESRGQIDITVAHLRGLGLSVMRAGAFKPRTNPGNFEGLKEEGLKIFSEMREKYGVLIATELLDPRHAEMFLKHNVDIVQIGTRNMANYELLKVAGQMNVPVILKRGWAATIDEWLQAADYILYEQKEKQVILCERGLRNFDSRTRNILDISAVPVIKELSWLPIIIDPSHAAGKAAYVPSLALSAVAAGADGLIVEVHNNPREALTDGAQSLNFAEFGKMYHDIKKIAKIQKRKLA